MSSKFVKNSKSSFRYHTAHDPHLSLFGDALCLHALHTSSLILLGGLSGSSFTSNPYYLLTNLSDSRPLSFYFNTSAFSKGIRRRVKFSYGVFPNPSRPTLTAVKSSSLFSNIDKRLLHLLLLARKPKHAGRFFPVFNYDLMAHEI